MDYIFVCTVNCSMFERNEKKYLELELADDDPKRIYNEHLKSSKFLTNRKIQNPLEGNILEVKIPFRYNRVSCKVNGDKTIQELIKNDSVMVSLHYCGVWNIGDWSGFSWRLDEIKYIN